MVTIILPVDFGQSTEKLVKAAVDFAIQTNGRICLLHVAPSDLGFAIGDMGFQYFPEVEQLEIKEELSQLNQIEATIKSFGVDCEHLLKQGSPGEIVLEYAKDKDANYIVLGSHGRSNFYDVFVGSLTKEITKRSPIPVVVIPVHD